MRCSHHSCRVGEIQRSAVRWHLPPYQRGYVWTESQAIDLVDSLCLGYPIGTIVTWCPPGMDWHERLVIDGQQRVSTLLGHRVGDPSTSAHDVWLTPAGPRTGGGTIPLPHVHDAMQWLFEHAPREEAGALLRSPAWRALEFAAVDVVDLERATPDEVIEVFRRLALGSPLTADEAERCVAPWRHRV